MNVMAEYYDKG